MKRPSKKRVETLPAVVPDLVTRIHAEHAEVESALRSSVQHAINCGELLIEAKKSVRHGEWADWLTDNIKFSDRLAQVYMRFARLPVEKRNGVADLPLREALGAIRSREQRVADAEEAAESRAEKPSEPNSPSSPVVAPEPTTAGARSAAVPAEPTTAGPRALPVSVSDQARLTVLEKAVEIAGRRGGPLAKVHALLSKTQGRGAAPAEESAAIKKAQDLIEQYAGDGHVDYKPRPVRLHDNATIKLARDLEGLVNSFESGNSADDLAGFAETLIQDASKNANVLNAISFVILKFQREIADREAGVTALQICARRRDPGNV